VGNIDASISIASLRAGKEKTCRPTLVLPKKELVVKGMYHPLIENCVANDLTLRGKSILITGSNMSGKSTFLRTLTINSILAQTIYTCFADEFTAPVLKQFSSIRIDDNLFDGKSYYFQEVSIMGLLLKEATSSDQNLFVLDEVFKGTNTIERIAAAKAILSYLNRNDNLVIVSTHDIELADMLDHEYDLYHFTETVENDELHFDHRIKAGQLKTRNAIRILELSNYPTEVTSEARQISSALVTTKIVSEK
jgi:DNA mismatch repair ATPase MutS